MIELKFTVTAIGLDVPSSPEQEDPAVITETYFEMPIFFVVNGVNLIGSPDGSFTLSLSVLGFATAAREAIKRLQPGGCERIMIGGAGWLYFEETDGNIRFSTTAHRPNVQVPYHEALTAFQVFAADVGRVIEAHVPAIRNHPYWPRWFPPTDRVPPQTFRR